MWHVGSSWSYPLPTGGVSANYILNTFIIFCYVRIIDPSSPLEFYPPGLDSISVYRSGYFLYFSPRFPVLFSYQDLNTKNTWHLEDAITLRTLVKRKTKGISAYKCQSVLVLPPQQATQARRAVIATLPYWYRSLTEPCNPGDSSPSHHILVAFFIEHQCDKPTVNSELKEPTPTILPSVSCTQNNPIYQWKESKEVRAQWNPCLVIFFLIGN